MNLIDHMQMRMMLRRADAVIRRAREAKATHEHYHRPHVASHHLTGYHQPIKEIPMPLQYKIGPLYVVCMLATISAVAYLNYLYR